MEPSRKLESLLLKNVFEQDPRRIFEEAVGKQSEMEPKPGKSMAPDQSPLEAGVKAQGSREEEVATPLEELATADELLEGLESSVEASTALSLCQ